MIALQLWSSCGAVHHMGLLTKRSITAIRRSLTQSLWGKTHARKGEVWDPQNNLIPNIIPKFNLVKFTFTQIKPHSNQSCSNLHHPTGEGECVRNAISFALLRLMFFTLMCLLLCHKALSKAASPKARWCYSIVTGRREGIIRCWDHAWHKPASLKLSTHFILLI